MYTDEIANAEEVSDLLIEDYEAQGKPLPQPQTLGSMSPLQAGIYTHKL